MTWKSNSLNIEGPKNFRDILVPLRKATKTGGLGRTLDIGCNSAWLAGHIEDYWGIDTEESIVKLARKHWGKLKTWDQEEACKRIQSTRLENYDQDMQSFDTIILRDVLEHIPNSIEFFELTLKYLKSNGVLFLSTPDAQKWVWADPSHLRPYPRKAHRWFSDSFNLDIVYSGYESTMPGTQKIAKLFKNKSPFFVNMLAMSRLIPRNVISIFRKA